MRKDFEKTIRDCHYNLTFISRLSAAWGFSRAGASKGVSGYLAQLPPISSFGSRHAFSGFPTVVSLHDAAEDVISVSRVQMDESKYNTMEELVGASIIALREGRLDDFISLYKEKDSFVRMTILKARPGEGEISQVFSAKKSYMEGICESQDFIERFAEVMPLLPMDMAVSLLGGMSIFQDELVLTTVVAGLEDGFRKELLSERAKEVSANNAFSETGVKELSLIKKMGAPRQAIIEVLSSILNLLPGMSDVNFLKDVLSNKCLSVKETDEVLGSQKSFSADAVNMLLGFSEGVSSSSSCKILNFACQRKGYESCVEKALELFRGTETERGELLNALVVGSACCCSVKTFPVVLSAGGELSSLSEEGNAALLEELLVPDLGEDYSSMRSVIESAVLTKKMSSQRVATKKSDGL